MLGAVESDDEDLLDNKDAPSASPVHPSPSPRPSPPPRLFARLRPLAPWAGLPLRASAPWADLPSPVLPRRGRLSPRRAGLGPSPPAHPRLAFCPQRWPPYIRLLPPLAALRSCGGLTRRRMTMTTWCGHPSSTSCAAHCRLFPPLACARYVLSLCRQLGGARQSRLVTVAAGHGCPRGGSPSTRDCHQPPAPRPGRQAQVPSSSVWAPVRIEHGRRSRPRALAPPATGTRHRRTPASSLAFLPA
jgi:hypothetical protein